MGKYSEEVDREERFAPAYRGAGEDDVEEAGYASSA
jgi:hypothetical protein